MAISSFGENMVKIFLGSNGQVRVTIPKALATALEFRHKDEVEFIMKDNNLIMRKKK